MDSSLPIINFRLDARSGLPPYRQLVDQVRQAVSLGLLRPGDRLPSVREVVGQVTINPNTVHRAYRDLEHEGIVEGRPGIGTFVVALSVSPVGVEDRTLLLAELRAWVDRARDKGFDSEGITALIATAVSTEAAVAR
jgi:GntR family transcriptional regulator